VPWRVENPYNLSSYGTIRQLYGRHRICLQACSQRHMGGAEVLPAGTKTTSSTDATPKRRFVRGPEQKAKKAFHCYACSRNPNQGDDPACALSIPSLYSDHTICVQVLRQSLCKSQATRPPYLPQSPSSRGIRQQLCPILCNAVLRGLGC
jgi:hypothetical protein